MSDYLRLLDAMLAVKHLPRKGWIQHGLEPSMVESVAAHSFGTAFLAIMLHRGGILPDGIPIDRLLALAIFHDITESITGDLTPNDAVSPEKKMELELAASKQLLEGVKGMESLKKELDKFISSKDLCTHELVHDIVKQLDKLDMMIQALVYERNSGKNMSDFYENPGKHLNEPGLVSFFQSVKELMKSRP